MGSAPERQLGKLFVVGMGWALAALLFFAWLAGAVAEGSTMEFDARVRLLVYERASPALTSVMRFFTDLGSVFWLTILGSVVLAAFLLAGWSRAAILFVITMGGASVLNAALKLLFQRARPDAFFDVRVPSSYSFPSGHALLALCFFGFLAAVASSRLRSRAARVAVWSAAALVSLLVGVSRIYLGVHYPTDVVAGYAAASVWLSMVAYGYLLLRRRRERPPVRQVKA